MKKLFLILLIPILVYSQATYQKTKYKQVWYDATKETQTSSWSTIDSSAIEFDKTSTGKWWIKLYNAVGSLIFKVDTLGVVTADSIITSSDPYGDTYYWLANGSNIYTTSKVGIGVTNPVSVIDIKPSTSVSPINIKTNDDSTLMYVTNTGRIGIGTTYPSDDDQYYRTKMFIIDNNSDSMANTDEYSEVGLSVRRNVFGDREYNYGTFVFCCPGVGTTNPKVSVNVGSQVNTKVIGDSTATHGFGNDISVYSYGTTGNITATESNVNINSGSAQNAYNFAGNSVVIGNVTNYYGFKINKTVKVGTITNYYGIYLDDIVGSTNNFSFYAKGGLLYNSGAVGIGTSTPKSKLDVEGSMSVGTTYSGTSAAPTNGLIVEGNVGIGLTAPASKLHISGGGVKSDSSTIGAGGVWMRNMIWSGDSLGVIAYRPAISRIDTVWMKQ